MRSLGGTPIDYQRSDFVQLVRDTTGKGVDMVFDGIGGWNLIRSFKTLGRGGRLIAYGLQSSLNQGKRSLGRVASDAVGWGTAFALGLVSPTKRVRLYSIQMLKRRHPDWFREDLTALLDLLAGDKLKPIIAAKLPLEQAASAHERLSEGDVVWKVRADV